MATPWTLEKELCGLAGASCVRDALLGLGMIEDPVPEPALEEVTGWKRGGAETFIYRFRVVQDDEAHDVILKAVVAFSTARSLAEIGEDWLARRQLLAQEGVATPHLYHFGRGLVVEEFIPEHLSGFLKRRPFQSAHLFDQVIRYAAALEKHGFCPIAPFHALRTDGTDIFAVDFGQDLGPPGVATRRGRRLLRDAINWLSKASSQSIDESRATAVFSFHVADGKSEGYT